MRSNTLSRRDFLTGGIKQVKSRLCFRDKETSDGAQQTAAGIEVPPDITSDLPPELLAFEAERLGLDPDDREGVLKAVQDCMASK